MLAKLLETFAVTPKKRKKKKGGGKKKKSCQQSWMFDSTSRNCSKCMHEFRVHAWYGESPKKLLQCCNGSIWMILNVYRKIVHIIYHYVLNFFFLGMHLWHIITCHKIIILLKEFKKYFFYLEFSNEILHIWLYLCTKKNRLL